MVNIKKILKQCWQALPETLQNIFLSILFLLTADKRNNTNIDKQESYFVCAAFYNNNGIAQGARVYAENLKKKGLQVYIVDITSATLQKHNYIPKDEPLTIQQAKKFLGKGTVIIHANPPLFQLALCRFGKEFLKNKYLIAYWACEIAYIPTFWEQAINYIDAIEVPSNFVQKIINRYTNKPVKVVPHSIQYPIRHKQVFAADGIIRCLFIFDMVSFERKNPIAALQTFEQAFSPNEAEMTFKISNVNAEPKKFAEFQSICSRLPNVRIICDDLSQDQIEELYLKNDIYLSLHRSEGYGLTILEAMLYGLYVVATGYSGNMEFMKGEFVYPIPYTLQKINHKRCKMLNADWAEADQKAAADILRKIKVELTKK